MKRLAPVAYALVVSSLALTSILLISLGVLSACATTSGRSTINLTTSGVVALHATEVVKGLDIIRDVAMDAETQGLVSHPTTVTVVLWHQAAVTTIRSAPSSWKATILAGLDALKAGLPPPDAKLIGPYIAAATLTIKAVIP